MAEESEVAAVRTMASGLAAVRDAIRKQHAGSTDTDERKALARVADSPAFAGLGPNGVTAHDRGRWIAGRVRVRLLELEAEVSRDGRGHSAADRAVRCWARFVDEGLFPVELYAAHPELLHHRSPTETRTAQRDRAKSLMWAGGARSDKDSLPGVRVMAAELRGALSVGVPGGAGSNAAVFAYEWERLKTVDPAGRELLQILARLAPDRPFPRALLRESGNGLPDVVQELCARPAELRAVCAIA